jgi:hypothetical protein
LKAALGVGVVAMALQAWRRIRAMRSLRLDGSRGLCLVFQDGAEATGRVQDGCFVAPWLAIVRWRPEGAWFDRTVVILPGMTGRDEFRRLRVLLRWR